MMIIPDLLKDPQAVCDFMQDPSHHNPNPTHSFINSWSPLSLGDGLPGILVLFSALQSDVAHLYVLKIKQLLESDGVPSSLSLYGGLGGICYALHLASQGGKRYQRMLHTLNQILLQGLDRYYIAPLWANIRSNTPSTTALYDVVQGLSGVGRYLLETEYPVHDILKAMIAFTNPLVVGGRQVPGWYNIEEETPRYNLGLAHGIPGVLSFLAIASLKGVEVEGQKEAIASVADWICKFPIVEENRMRWPYHVEEVINQGTRDAWCYGSPGVSSALFLAGKALSDESLKQFALRSFSDIFTRTRREWHLPGPAICHGIAGLLLAASVMGDEKKVVNLTGMLLAHYNPEFPFGFKDIEPCKDGSSIALSKAGLLEGAAGIFLTLHHLKQPNDKNLLPFFFHV